MRELGIDLSAHTSKSLDTMDAATIDRNLVEVYACLTEAELAEKPPHLQPTPLS